MQLGDNAQVNSKAWSWAEHQVTAAGQFLRERQVAGEDSSFVFVLSPTHLRYLPRFRFRVQFDKMVSPQVYV